MGGELTHRRKHSTVKIGNHQSIPQQYLGFVELNDETDITLVCRVMCAESLEAVH